MQDYRSRSAKAYAWMMLVSVPISALFVSLLLLLRESGLSHEVKRQLINCFVSFPVFLTTLGLMVAMFLFSARSGASAPKIIAEHRLSFLAYIIVVTLLGMFALQTSFLTHDWFYWSFTRRVSVALSNFAIVALASAAYLFLWLIPRQVTLSRSAKLYLAAALLLWGYVLASGVRMLPLPYVTSVE